MKRVLIITKEQFGYLTDTYNYCINLSKDIEISYICLDNNKPKIHCNQINVFYVEQAKSNNISSFRLSKYVSNHIKSQKEKYDAIFCVFFRFCFLIPLLSYKARYIMDIRTGNVTKNKLKNSLVNTEIKLSSIFFEKVSIISESLASKLKIKKYTILPLGANKVINNKHFSIEMNLLYVGTFNNRRIYDTIRGYHEYLVKRKSLIPTKYTLVGDGSKEEVDQILYAIKKYDLQDKVELVGRINNSELGYYFEKHNIGVSYIPITEYYDVQPPTKTYEYTMNGLICIATDTKENKKIINEINGLICKDNPSSFADGLISIERSIRNYDPEEISKSVIGNNWESISRNIFMPILTE